MARKEDTSQKEKKNKKVKPLWIVISFVVLIAIMFIPTGNSIPVMAKLARGSGPKDVEY